MYNITESGSVWMSCLFIVITRGQKGPNLQLPSYCPDPNQTQKNKAGKTVNLNYKRDKQSNQHRYVLMTISTLLAKLLYLINRKNILYVCTGYTFLYKSHGHLWSLLYTHTHTHAPLHRACPHYDFNDRTKDLNMVIGYRIF